MTWSAEDELKFREMTERREKTQRANVSALYEALKLTHIADLSATKLVKAVDESPTVADQVIAALKPFSSNP